MKLILSEKLIYRRLETPRDTVIIKLDLTHLRSLLSQKMVIIEGFIFIPSISGISCEDKYLGY